MHASGAVSSRVLICMPYGEMSGHQSCKSYTYAYSENCLEFILFRKLLVLRNWSRLRGHTSRGMVKKVARGLSQSPPHDQDRAANVHYFVMFMTKLLMLHCIRVCEV